MVMVNQKVYRCPRCNSPITFLPACTYGKEKYICYDCGLEISVGDFKRCPEKLSAIKTLEKMFVVSNVTKMKK